MDAGAAVDLKWPTLGRLASAGSASLRLSSECHVGPSLPSDLTISLSEIRAFSKVPQEDFDLHFLSAILGYDAVHLGFSRWTQPFWTPFRSERADRAVIDSTTAGKFEEQVCPRRFILIRTGCGGRPQFSLQVRSVRRGQSPRYDRRWSLHVLRSSAKWPMVQVR